MSGRETQPQRTTLAWERTGIGALAVAGLLALRAFGAGRPALLLPAAVAAMAGLAVLGILAPARARRLRPGTGSASAPGLAAAATAAVVVVAVAALVAVALGLPR